MKHTYIIGEIGQNHNGSVDIAKLMVDLCHREVHEETFNIKLKPMDAIKLQKRDLTEELSISKMNEPYISPNSFGSTYGIHRKNLELDNDAHFEIYKHAKSKNLDFIETVCAVGSLSLLRYFIPDYLKVASRDLTNLPLLTSLAETKIPIILSTGMSGKKELDDALNVITKSHENISILHCVSEYPTHPSNVNLKTITYLKSEYPSYRIGFSDHTIGISAAVAAVALGAEIIEKHITIDRRMKGSDQINSLGPDGIFRMVRDIRLTEQELGIEDIFISEGVKETKIKLERSIATKKEISKDEIITEGDLHLLSPGDGYKWSERGLIIGKKAKYRISKDEIIYKEMLDE